MADGVRFAVNVQPYESYTQTDPEVTLEGVTIPARTETAYKQQDDLHSYGKTKTIELIDQPWIMGSPSPQNQRFLEDMDKAVQERVENVSWSFGLTGITVPEAGLVLIDLIGGVATSVTITDGGEGFSTFGGGAFTTEATLGGGAGLTGTIDTVTLAPLADTTGTWHRYTPNVTDPVRLYYPGQFYDATAYTVTAATGSGSGATGSVTGIDTFMNFAFLMAGTVTNRGTNYKIGDIMNVVQPNNSSDGQLQVDRTDGGGVITAVTITDGGSNYIVGDTVNVIQDAVIEDSYSGNTCDVGTGAILTISGAGSITYPEIEAIYIKNLEPTNYVELSVNGGTIYDIEIGPGQGFFSRLKSTDGDDMFARAKSGAGSCDIEYLLFIRSG